MQCFPPAHTIQQILGVGQAKDGEGESRRQKLSGCTKRRLQSGCSQSGSTNSTMSDDMTAEEIEVRDRSDESSWTPRCSSAPATAEQQRFHRVGCSLWMLLRAGRVL